MFDDLVMCARTCPEEFWPWCASAVFISLVAAILFYALALVISGTEY